MHGDQFPAGYNAASPRRPQETRHSPAVSHQPGQPLHFLLLLLAPQHKRFPQGVRLACRLLGVLNNSIGMDP